MKSLIILLILSVTLTGAMAFNFGGDGSEYGHLGASVGAGTPAAPCSPGASNGALDFSVCSNIVYVPALIH